MSCELESSQGQLYTVATQNNLKRYFVSIEYPGRVINDENAFRTMGGLTEMSVVHATENRKIELRFRPDDPYCKCTHGEQQSTSNLLMKVIKKIRRNKRTNEEHVTYEIELKGVVNKTYKFLGLCDFQYLPMLPNPTPNAENSDKYISILHKLLPEKLESISWIKEDQAIFLAPPVFSRMDAPVDYQFKKESSACPQYLNEGNVIGRMRKKRTNQAIFLDYNSGPVPTQPRTQTRQNLALRFIEKDSVAIIEKLFQERPIWTKGALSHHAVTVDKNSMKFILATEAYYFQTGPWRNAWVRIGYDPRLDPSARTMQILDYRVNHSFKSKILPKRSYSKYTQPHKFASTMRSKVSTIRSDATLAPAASTSAATEADAVDNDNLFLYRPGMIPACRQMFYQYCDIHVPEVMKLLESTKVNDVCDERYGWFPANVEEDCRKILNAHMAKAFDELKPKKKKQKLEEEEDYDGGEEEEESEEENNLNSDNEEGEEDLSSSSEEDGESLADDDQGFAEDSASTDAEEETTEK